MLLDVPFHVPRVDTKVTVVVVEGTETVNATGVPRVPAIAVELAAGEVIWKVEVDVPVIVNVVVRVSPMPVMVTVTVPAEVGVTLVEKLPLASVVPEV